MNKRDSNQLLMAHWMEAWQTLGRWQALNARLSRELTPRDVAWTTRSSVKSRWHEAAAAGSARI